MPIYERMTIRGRGGALPQYQSQQEPYVPGQGVSARLSDSRAGIEAAGEEARMKAVAGLGKAVKDAVDVGLQAADDYAKTKATELVTKYKMEMRQSMYGDGGILTREGESAFTANADTMKRSKELRAELLKDLNGSLVAQKFNVVIDPEEAEYSLKAQEYEGKQYRVFQDRTDEAAFKEASESAMYGYADGKTWAKGVGEALHFQERMLRRKGYTGEALERGLKESGSKIFAGGIEQALAANDLAAARRLLKQGEGSRMTADDVAKARKAIKVKQEALSKKYEAEKAKADFEAASADVVTILDSAPDEKEALAQVEKKVEGDEEKRKVYMSAWDAVLKQRAENKRRTDAAAASAFYQQIGEQVKEMDAVQFTSFIYTVDDPDRAKFARAKWEEAHSNKPRILVSEPAFLEAALDDMLIGGMSASKVAMKYVDHLNDEDIAKLHELETKNRTAQNKAVATWKTDLQSSTDIRNDYLKILRLNGSKLTEDQIRKKQSFLLQAQEVIDVHAKALGRKLTPQELRKIYDNLIIVTKDRWLGADERAYENPQPEPVRPIGLPDSAVWMAKTVPASNDPNDKSTKVIWTWYYPDGSYVPETTLKQILKEVGNG